jgi:hypothetical protein
MKNATEFLDILDELNKLTKETAEWLLLKIYAFDSGCLYCHLGSCKQDTSFWYGVKRIFGRHNISFKEFCRGIEERQIGSTDPCSGYRHQDLLRSIAALLDARPDQP